MADWKRVSKRLPCAICGRPDYCTVSADGTVAKCMRVPSGKPVPQRDGSVAYVHRITDAAARDAVAKLPSVADAQRMSIPEVKATIKQQRSAVNPNRLTRLAERLGVSVRALKAYGIGWDGKRGAWSFPMYDGKCRPIGLRLRTDEGRKLCVPGSRNGLFVPLDYEAKKLPDLPGMGDRAPLLLLLPEGPTDAAAALDLGFRAVGRPSNNGGAELLVELLGEGDRQEVIVVADHDETKWRPLRSPQWPSRTVLGEEPFWPGIEGALAVCDRIQAACASLRFLLPPVKDIRQWLGEREAAVIRAYVTDEAKVVTAPWLRRQWERLEERRRAESKIVTPAKAG